MAKIHNMKDLSMIALIAILFTFYSCGKQFDMYQSDWIIEEFSVSNEDAIELLNVYNFSIDVIGKTAGAPTVYLNTKRYRCKDQCNIRFFKKNGSDYMELLGHEYLKGIYKVACRDKSCCRIVLENDKFHFLLAYNGDMIFGFDRDCY